jgi:hypothetical protein
MVVRSVSAIDNHAPQTQVVYTLTKPVFTTQFFTTHKNYPSKNYLHPSGNHLRFYEKNDVTRICLLLWIKFILKIVSQNIV